MEGASTVVAAKISSAEAKLIDAIKDYLSEKGEDVNRDVLIDTPERFVKQSLKITQLQGDFLYGEKFQFLVRMKGLEPSRREAHAPKACVSTNSTTSA